MQVGFDYNFFAKSLNDYSDWKWSFAREAMQNCIDSGANTTQVDISYSNNEVVVVFANDGRPMSQDTIVNKLMNVGGTTKEGSCDGGEVGGFGVAKICLYFAHKYYRIISGKCVVTGTGGQYEIEPTGPDQNGVQKYHNGTKSIVTIASDTPERLAQELSDQFIRFASFAQWRGRIELTFEGRTRSLACSLHKGYFRNEFKFGRLYTNPSYNGLLIFRINGIPMFTKSIGYEGCAIFEATKGSIELMTSNRDSLKYTYQWEIDDVIKRFSTNRSSVLNKSPIYEVYGNTLMGVELPPEPKEVKKAPAKDEPQPNNDLNQFAEAAARLAQEHPDLVDPVDETENGTYVLDRSRHTEGTVGDAIIANDDRRPAKYTRKFMILNESGMTTPAYIRPDKMSSYCSKLLSIWTNLMCTTYRVNKARGHFAVGFCLGDAIAKHVNRDDVTYYLINPFDIVEQVASQSRSFKRRYHLVQDREDLIMSAVHEFIHGALDARYHDENFSSILTTLAGVAMKNHKEYKKCFRSY